MSDEVQASTAVVRQRIGDRTPRVALVLGSGLGGLADQVTDAVAISYADLPGFPKPGVQGHAGRLVVGDLGGRTVVCMQGRSHAYEGHPPQRLAIPVRTCRSLGCDVLVLTNAAGSLRPEMGPGSLMIIEDHINWSGMNPLIGPNDDSIGPRFFDMSNAYDSALREQIKQAASHESITVHEGVYFWYLGPSFETPAEIRAFQTLGASAVGMSTVPECLSAVHCGMRVAAISVITNLAAGLQAHALSHQETMEQSAQAAAQFQRLLIRFLSDMTLD